MKSKKPGRRGLYCRQRRHALLLSCRIKACNPSQVRFKKKHDDSKGRHVKGGKTEPTITD